MAVACVRAFARACARGVARACKRQGAYVCRWEVCGKDKVVGLGGRAAGSVYCGRGGRGVEEDGP
eukprot:1269158-Pyramimonas_sp.AAC.1